MSHAKKKSPIKNLASFKAEYDPDIRIPALIAAGIKSLLAEGFESWEYEQDFLRRCGPGVGNSNITKYRPLFEKHIVEVKQGRKNPKRIWFADPKVAAKARGG
jgi:hypothetical protein